MIDAVRKEMDPEVAAVGLECIHETLNVMGGNILTNDQVKEMLRLMKAFIFASGKRREDALSTTLPPQPPLSHRTRRPT